MAKIEPGAIVTVWRGIEQRVGQVILSERGHFGIGIGLGRGNQGPVGWDQWPRTQDVQGRLWVASAFDCTVACMG